MPHWGNQCGYGKIRPARKRTPAEILATMELFLSAWRKQYGDQSAEVQERIGRIAEFKKLHPELEAKCS